MGVSRLVEGPELAPDERPNVLFITTDQQRGDCIGADRSTAIRTPNIDRLAAGGVVFEAAYSESPVCVPCRMVWMKGRHPWDIGQDVWTDGAPTPEESLPGAFARAGHHAAGLGKMHVHPPREMFGFHERQVNESGRMWPKFGHDDYHLWLAEETPWGGYTRGTNVGNNEVFGTVSPLPEEYHVNSWTAKITVDYLRRSVAERPGQPFFAFMSFSRPHSPYDPPRPWDQCYCPLEMPRPFGKWGDIDSEPHAIRTRSYQMGLDRMCLEQVSVSRAAYWGQISHIDECIGRVLHELEALGLAENTAVMFSADHGDLMGDHNAFFKGSFYDGSARVPMVIYMPPGLRKRFGVEAGVRVSHPVGAERVYSSLVEMAGIEPYGAVTGRGLIADWRGEAPPEPYVFGCYGQGRLGYSLMARGARYKYIWWQADGVEQLFDMAEDPGEERNLAGESDFESVLAEHRGALVDHLKRYERTEGRVIENGELKSVPWTEEMELPRFSGPWGRRPY